MIRAPDARPLVDAEEDLEVGHELEELAVEEACRDLVATGELLDQGFGEIPVTLRFRSRHESGSIKPCEIIGDGLVFLDEECRGRRVQGVASDDKGDRVEQGGLAVGAEAIRNEETLLPRVSRQGVPDSLL